MAEGSIVTVETLTHRYGERAALDGVSFEVTAGSLFGLLGPNGGGKTTLFKVLTTLLRPTSGRACVAGADVVAERDRVRSRIGIVFQKTSLDGKLTVRENVEHQGRLYGLSGAALSERCGEVLDRFGLSDRAGERCDKLSGGLQRRLELAKSLLHRPRVLILDEPGTGLDPAARAAFMNHLCALRDRDGVTCLLTTHLMDEAQRCERIGFLDRGRLAALDAPSALKRLIGGDVVTVTADDPAGLSEKIKHRFGGAVELIDGTIRMEKEHGHEFVTELIEAFPGLIDSVTVAKPTLEDVFVHLTGRRLSDDDTNQPGNGNAGKRRG